MKKLTLNQLEVEKFALKISERESTNLKRCPAQHPCASAYTALSIHGPIGIISTSSWPTSKPMNPKVMSKTGRSHS